MEKNFVLICTNEAHDVVSLELFDSWDDAHEKMKQEYNSKLADFDTCGCAGYTGFALDSMLYDDSAVCAFHDAGYGYYWHIVELA